jgi:hypothetical protein
MRRVLHILLLLLLLWVAVVALHPPVLSCPSLISLAQRAAAVRANLSRFEQGKRCTTTSIVLCLFPSYDILPLAALCRCT